MICRLFLIFCLFILSGQAYAEMTITVRGPESNTDQRYRYYKEIMRLALEATRPDYGDFKLLEAKAGENNRRSLHNLKTGRYPNFFVRISATDELVRKLDYIPYPLDRGVVGYRVAFISDQSQQKISAIKNVEQLKKLSILQGDGWLDNDILTQNGFKVVLGSSYDGLFEMVARKRADLFLRGANEIMKEWNEHRTVRNLAIEPDFAIYYPLPRFFFTNKKNQTALKRVRAGIKRIIDNGQFFDLWKKFHGPSLNLVNLHQRHIFKFENPFIKHIDPEYKKYLFDPETVAVSK